MLHERPKHKLPEGQVNNAVEIATGSTQTPSPATCRPFWVLFLLRFYLFLERGREGKKRGRETSMCGCLSYTPYWGPGPQPRHVP